MWQKNTHYNMLQSTFKSIQSHSMTAQIYTIVILFIVLLSNTGKSNSFAFTVENLRRKVWFIQFSLSKYCGNCIGRRREAVSFGGRWKQIQFQKHNRNFGQHYERSNRLLFVSCAGNDKHNSFSAGNNKRRYGTWMCALLMATIESIWMLYGHLVNRHDCCCFVVFFTSANLDHMQLCAQHTHNTQAHTRDKFVRLIIYHFMFTTSVACVYVCVCFQNNMAHPNQLHFKAPIVF